MNTFFPLTRFAVVGLALSGCSLGHSASNDVNSSNPAVALQAQKIVDLEQQVATQEKAVDTQNNLADVEKKKLDGLKQQLDGAKQNLKGVKTTAKTQ